MVDFRYLNGSQADCFSEPPIAGGGGQVTVSGCFKTGRLGLTSVVLNMMAGVADTRAQRFY